MIIIIIIIIIIMIMIMIISCPFPQRCPQHTHKRAKGRCRKAEMTGDTLHALWKVFGWSCNSLLRGISPEVDWERRPILGGAYLDGGYRAALVQLRGDWDFSAVNLGLANWAHNIEMCWQCRASNLDKDLLWGIFR